MMSVSVIYILISLFQNSNSQWIKDESFLEKDKTFTQQTGQLAFINSGYFIQPSTQNTANFITCTTPATSYITLTNSYPSAQSYYYYSFNGYWISMDLYFQGTWSSETVQFTLGSFTYSYSYTSPTTYSIITGFCDALPYEVKTVNFTLGLTSSSISGQFKLTSTNINTGQVSLRNIYISKVQCYPSCRVCTGPENNQCTSCYYGLPTNNICPPCPSNQYYWKNQGCKDICDIKSPLYSNGFCQNYPNNLVNQIEQGYLTNPIYWSLIYDQQHVDTSPTIIRVVTQINENSYLETSTYGVFKLNSGIYRFFKGLPTYSYEYYLIGFKISIVALNDFPINCGIQFKINNTYFGSIYRNASGIQTHKLTISQTSYSTQSNNKSYDLITYVDIPKYQFLFSAIGNYTDGTVGWGMSQIQITSGYCPLYCSLCEVAFKCKTCSGGYYYYRDGSCISGCSYPYQKLNGQYCYDYDDETPYSQYLIQEHINAAGDPEQYTKYTLISQSGTNFLKGSDIYFSYYQGIRIFGGPFVWAQAKFQRIHNIITPHHGVTIAFYILYGPTFPSDGQFKYSIEDNTPVIKSTASYYSSNSDGTKQDGVYEKIIHNTNTLTITWECFGPNNEPVQAYCGFYNYYIAVHNCQPYCLSCTDQNTCTSWNSTYDADIVKFSQEECLINQYYDKESVRCLDCPLSCLTCTSKINCQSCSSTYTLTKLGCICTINQYEDSNQCFNCPIECNQCLSSTYCIECLIINNRQLLNGQCNCIDGYYPIPLNPQCQLCHQFCKTCNGPTSDECLTCNNIVNIEQVGSTCRCPTGSYFQAAIKTCSICHPSCLTCFRSTNNGCLTCNPALNRILKGLKCTCASGYYELSNICTSCPTTENVSLSQCYKQCNNNQLIWHTITCNSCDSGFQLVSGECQPICGNTLIQGYEQCEDNNTIQYDGCYNCQFQCPIHCLTCDSSTTLPCPDVCGDGIITGVEECEDGNTIQYDGCYNCKYQCQSPCTKCIKGQCFECATLGWYIDPTVTPWQCKERCGDQQVVGSEQCDDGNISDTDGCKDCKYFCRIGCSSCDYTTNTCLSCEFSGFVPQSYYCKNVCGDGLVVTDPYGFYSEECDDRNTINDDGCNNSCLFQCQSPSICISCISNRCEICATGYYLTNDKVCLPICEDSNLVVGEQCENSFILPYKGCINCQAKCQSSCLNCSTSGLGCLSCKIGYNRIDNLCYSICGDQIITENEQCDDGNLIIGDGCHFCEFSCQDSCLNCIKGVCYDCQEGYQLISFKCYPICGDGVQKQNEQCEMINALQINQRCTSCQFTCDLNCYLCQFGICQLCNEGYELSSNQYYCIKSLQYPSTFIENCQVYIGNSCIQCEIYAQLDKIEQKCNFKEPPMSFCQYQLKLSSNVQLLTQCLECEFGYYGNKCMPKCGDGIIVQEEECDDGNQYDVDTCLNCKYQCPQYCKQCAYGVCTHCFVGFYLDIVSNSCNSVCGDKILASDEVCDDGNELRYDGCFECKYQCQMECLNCQFGRCMECESPLIAVQSKGICEKQKSCEGLIGLQYDNFSNDCLPQCGDGIVVDTEQCDDQNNTPYDGCYECKIQCQIGFLLDQSTCIPICGDGIVTAEYENCDDQNDQPYDGCFECQFQCIQNCLICQKGICLQCDINYSFQNTLCLLNNENDSLNSSFIGQSYMNDTIINDYNLQWLLLNEDKICRDSECAYSKKLSMKLTYKNQYFALQYVDITFDQKVKFSDKVINNLMLFNISIVDLDSQNYNITINPIQDISFDLQYAQYQVVIEIFQQLSTDPILLVKMNQEIVNQDNRTFDNLIKSINLQKPKIISEQFKQISINAQKSNKAFMIGAISLCVISLVSGENSMIVETLNLLQYQQYLRFINLDYPENIQIYFQAYDMLSITSYLQIVKIDDYLNIITAKNKQIDLSGKFKQYDIQADFIINILPQLIQILGFVSLPFFAKALFTIFLKLSNYMVQIQNKNTLKSRILIPIIQKFICFRILMNSLMKIKYQTVNYQILVIIYINSWDLIFKVILELYYDKFDNLRSILTSVFATLILFICICFQLKSLSVFSGEKQNNLQSKLEIKFIILDIFRTLFFHTVLILFQDDYILQSLLIQVSSLSQCFIIYKYKQCSKWDRIIFLSVEGILTIFNFSLFLYFDISQIYLSYENKVTLGFYQMTILILSLAIVITKQLYPKILNIQKLTCKKKSQKYASSQLFYF